MSLLSWVMNTYPGNELMQHVDLRVDIAKIGPVLRPELLKQLETEYLKVVFFNLFIFNYFLTKLCAEHGTQLRGMDDENVGNGKTRLAR